MTKFKNVMRIALLGVAAAALAAPVLAQDQDAAPPPPPAHGGPGRNNSPEMQAKMLDRMTKALSLTPDQVTQIKAIQADESAKMAALSSGEDAGGKGGRKQMMAIHRDGMSRTRAVLTDDQKVKFDAMQEKMKDREQRKGGEGSAPPHPTT